MSSLRDAVRDKLREDKVRLWLPPYDTSDAVDALAKTYAGVLQAPEQDVAAHLADLGRAPSPSSRNGHSSLYKGRISRCAYRRNCRAPSRAPPSPRL